MIDNNFNKTQYSHNIQQYLERNNDGLIGGASPQKRVDLLKQYLPLGRKIFEIGSGGCIDAIALQQAGYMVTASDFVPEFVENGKKMGIDIISFDAKQDEFPETDAVYANAVFVHFTPEEVVSCLRRARVNLRNEKIVFISVLKGKGYERSSRGRGFTRDFYYYSYLSLSQLLEQEKYEILFKNDADSKWLQIICRANNKIVLI